MLDPTESSLFLLCVHEPLCPPVELPTEVHELGFHALVQVSGDALNSGCVWSKRQVCRHVRITQWPDTGFQRLGLCYHISFDAPNFRYENDNLGLMTCSRKSLQKLPCTTIFHVLQAGYWLQFSTSNNSTSLFDHGLLYRHCAKLPADGMPCPI